MSSYILHYFGKLSHILYSYISVVGQIWEFFSGIDGISPTAKRQMTENLEVVPYSP